MRELDKTLLEDNDGQRRIILYYGRADHWTPLEYHTELTAALPGREFHLCERGFEHAFVLFDVAPVAELVAGWLRPK